VVRLDTEGVILHTWLCILRMVQFIWNFRPLAWWSVHGPEI